MFSVPTTRHTFWHFRNNLQSVELSSLFTDTPTKRTSVICVINLSFCFWKRFI